MTTLHAVALVHDSGLTDGQWLDRFVDRGEEAAFAALVRRHGAMVHGVCRRVLGNAHDADDAFQATFLVLVRRAAAVLPREQVGVWLHGVAYRTALKARTMAVRRRFRERQAGLERPEAVEAQLPDDLGRCSTANWTGCRTSTGPRSSFVSWRVVRGVRARQLGLPEGTLSSRLATGRAMLARRVVRSGVALSGLVALASAASARVPPTLAISTVRAALRVAAGKAGGVSASVAALTEGVVQSMKPTSWQLAAVVLMVALVGGRGCCFADEKPRRRTSPRR
jgi:DNA-directed RNA polymerase specialized sigma24 family protein